LKVKPHAAPLPLGREEGHEYFLALIRGNTWTVVRDHDTDDGNVALATSHERSSRLENPSVGKGADAPLPTRGMKG
jgi:hypothetical protein